MSSASRRSSTSSLDSFYSGRSRSPSLTAQETSALILLPDSEGSIGSPFDFSDEDDDYEPLEALSRSASSIHPLSPSTIFLYLLSPYLSLGALLLPSSSTPLKYGLGALVLFAALSAFVRHIWYMLARYMRTTSMEDVIVDAFARGRGYEKRRKALRSMIWFDTGLLRVLLATMYLRDAVDTLLPLLPRTVNVPYLPTRPTLTVTLALAILPLSLPTSIAAKRVIWATWASVISYVLWLGCVSYAHGKGSLGVSPIWLKTSRLWEGTTAIAFVFTSSSTLPLYAAKGSHQPVTTKTSKSRSFRILSISSVAIAMLLILPLVVFSASPNRPETSTLPPNPYLDALFGSTLVLRIPFLLVTTPKISIPTSVRRSTTTTFQDGLCQSLIWTLPLVLALACTLEEVGETIGKTLNDLGLIIALLGTYLVPAVVHITTHHFKQPLSIVIPNTPLATPFSPSDPSADSTSPHPASHHSSTTQSPYDELLQRKERALQRRRLGRRIIWDIGVWVLLVPIGGGGLVWSVRRVIEGW